MVGLIFKNLSPTDSFYKKWILYTRQDISNIYQFWEINAVLDSKEEMMIYLDLTFPGIKLKSTNDLTKFTVMYRFSILPEELENAFTFEFSNSLIETNSLTS